MKTKLTTKDLITAGAFGAIYLVLLTVLSSVLTIVPILFLATPLIAGIILGTVYMLYATKVPRTGAILVLAILVVVNLIASSLPGKYTKIELLCVQPDFYGSLLCPYSGKGRLLRKLCRVLWRRIYRNAG